MGGQRLGYQGFACTCSPRPGSARAENYQATRDVGWTRCAGIIAITEGRGPGQHDPLLAIVSYFENLGVLVMTARRCDSLKKYHRGKVGEIELNCGESSPVCCAGAN